MNLSDLFQGVTINGEPIDFNVKYNTSISELEINKPKEETKEEESEEEEEDDKKDDFKKDKDLLFDLFKEKNQTNKRKFKILKALDAINIQSDKK